MSGRQAQPQRLAPRPLRRGAVVGHQLYRQQLPIRSLSAYTPPPRCAGLRDAAGPCRRIWSRPARRRGPDRRSRRGRRRSGRWSGATATPRPAVPRAAPSMPPAPARGCASGSRAGAMARYCRSEQRALLYTDMVQAAAVDLASLGEHLRVGGMETAVRDDIPMPFICASNLYRFCRWCCTLGICVAAVLSGKLAPVFPLCRGLNS